ncbi:type IV secretory system conjugative DNA transfer family protein [Barrientosiimonas humi]|uniref:type IV secretory system conjugative DNA transfer family protein n=1 Tax=Barrientosiimonas humi TaxID=999931 RepID=UPI00370D1A34
MATSQSTPEESSRAGEVALLAGAAVLSALVGAVLAGGALAGWLFGGGWAWPSGQVIDTLGRLVREAPRPAAAYPPEVAGRVPGPVPFWGTVGALVLVLLTAAVVVAVLVASRRSRVGMLSRSQAKRVMKQLDSPLTPYGTYLGVKMRNRAEDATIVIAPQQMGKTTRVAIGRVMDAPAGCLATTTKSDLVAAVFYAIKDRQDRDVLVFDLDDVTGLPEHGKLKWDLVAGCEDPEEAIRRAAAMVHGRPVSSETSSNADFFAGKAVTVLQCFLHAAALEGLDARAVLRWYRIIGDDTPYEILSGHPNAAPGWAEDLRAETRGKATPTIESTMRTLGLALQCLSLPRVIDLVCPGPGEGFDVEGFIEANRDTLMVLSEGKTTASTGPLASAFSAVVTEAALRKGRRRKITPPFTLVLDEAANIAAMPDMDKLLTDGGGRGVNSWVFFQAISQMRQRWGRDGAATIWSGTSMKLLLPGVRGDELTEISRGLGEKVVRDTTHTRPGWWSGSGGSSSDSLRKDSVLAADKITHMEMGQALLLWKNVRPAVVQLPGYWERPDRKTFTDSLARFEQMQHEVEDDARLLSAAAREWRRRGAVVIARLTEGHVPIEQVTAADGSDLPEALEDQATLPGAVLLLRVRTWSVTDDSGRRQTAKQVQPEVFVHDPHRHGYTTRGPASAPAPGSVPAAGVDLA